MPQKLTKTTKGDHTRVGTTGDAKDSRTASEAAADLDRLFDSLNANLAECTRLADRHVEVIAASRDLLSACMQAEAYASLNTVSNPPAAVTFALLDTLRAAIGKALAINAVDPSVGDRKA